MLEGLDKPVVFTGAQIPLCELRSDGRDNLITSIMIAADGIIREVSLCFGDAILRGNRAIKYSADGMVAFTSPNCNKLADAGISIEYDHAAISDYVKNSLHYDSFNVVRLKECRIAVIKVVPGIQFEIFEPIMCEALDGLVLETFGKGNIPDYDPALSRLINEASRCGTIVVVCTQCPAGTVSLGTYEAGSALVRAGAVSGGNMTTEAAITKLTYLLSKDLSKTEIRKLMQTDLRGEITA
jgi:L-asparaginase